MNKDIAKFQKEQQELLKQSQDLDIKKNQIMLRLAEIQGILKYLQDKPKE